MSSFSMGPMEIAVIVLIAGLLIALPIGIVIAVVALSRRQANQESNPNLAPCPDCQKLISIHAPSCPNCGRPMKTG